MTAAPAFAGGVSAVPALVDVPDALRGSTIFREVILTNSTGEPTPFTITSAGDIAPWITIVDADDRTTEITEVFDIDGAGAEILIRIDVPDDAANGAYEGSLTAVLEAADSEDGVGVGLGVAIGVRLDVIGTEVIAATLGDLAISDTEVGVPARVLATIENTGNINVVPEFDIEFLRNGSVVSKTTTAGQPSFPGEQAVFELFWDTSNAEPGNYTARVGVDFGGVDLGTSDLEFVVHPAGTLDRDVVFTSLELDKQPLAGAFAGLTATVENPGQVDVSATVVGELTKGDAPVSSFESQPFLVRAGESVPIPLAVEIPDVGDYEFTARVIFGDSETASHTVAFTAVVAPTAVNADATAVNADATAGGIPVGVITLGVAALVALIGIGAWLRARRRSNDRSTDEAHGEDVDPDKQAATVGSED